MSYSMSLIVYFAEQFNIILFSAMLSWSLTISYTWKPDPEAHAGIRTEQLNGNDLFLLESENRSRGISHLL